MGPAIIAAGLIWGLAGVAIRRTTRAVVLLYAAMTMAFAMLTPIIRASALVDRVPIWLQLYLRPAGDMTMFTAFPWAGFVFAGAAAGALIAASHKQTERRVQVWLAAAGAALIVGGLYAETLPSIYARSSFWTSSPVWFAIRTGILMLALASIYAVAQACGRGGIELRRLERFGRCSLFVYWIHVELVYGYLTWPLHRRLPVWGTFLAYALFCVLMYRAVVLRDRIVERWHEMSAIRRTVEEAS